MTQMKTDNFDIEFVSEKKSGEERNSRKNGAPNNRLSCDRCERKKQTLKQKTLCFLHPSSPESFVRDVRCQRNGLEFPFILYSIVVSFFAVSKFTFQGGRQPTIKE